MSAHSRYPARLAATLVLVSVLGLSLSACSGPPQVTMVDEGAAYDLESVAALQTTIDRPSIVGSPVSDSTALRRDALVEFRSKGDRGSEFAEFITRTLPDNGRSVPYYGEAATVEDTEAWILLELWGSPGGTLDHVRIWVFDRERGEVLFSSTVK